MTAEDRAKLLKLISDGHDLESACVALDVTEDQITAGGDKLKSEIAGAFKAGTARLRARIMEGALSSDNTSILMKLLEQRQVAQEAQMARAATGPMDQMARIDFAKRVLFMLAEGMADDETRCEWMALVCQMRCMHCGNPPYVPKPTSTSPATDFPERRLNSHLK